MAITTNADTGAGTSTNGGPATGGPGAGHRVTTDIPGVVERLRTTFDTGVTRPYEWRRRQLEGLLTLLSEREPQLLEALATDLGKPVHEAWMADLGLPSADARYALKNLKGWMKPKRVSTPLSSQPATSKVYPDPLGVVCIIGPWNYPVQLLLQVLTGALAAGNTAVLKPSEVSSATSAALADAVPHYLDPDAVAVVEGGVPETTTLLEQRFDHIFYTGNGTVGRIVMAAAAKNLTPVTLELGGKSPVIVDSDADLDVAARRIVWGKFMNAGQTCIAPDYVLAHRSVEGGLLDAMRDVIDEFYGPDPSQSPDFARIIDERHFDRLTSLIDKEDESKIVVGGGSDRSTRYIAPTVVRDVDSDSTLMDEEIFGPILPVLTVDDTHEAIEFVNERDKPLALYVFSKDDGRVEQVLRQTSSGGACINATVMHVGSANLPFGGVGESGMGAYHGKASFDTFTHFKSVMDRPTLIDPPMMYPPYTSTKQKIVRKLLR